ASLAASHCFFPRTAVRLDPRPFPTRRSSDLAGEHGLQTFENVRNPIRVQQALYQEMEDNENRKFDRARGPVQSSVADELEKLAALRDRGALSEAEFEAQKARLLSS